LVGAFIPLESLGGSPTFAGLSKHTLGIPVNQVE
jgi:hypothetical protein